LNYLFSSALGLTGDVLASMAIVRQDFEWYIRCIFLFVALIFLVFGILIFINGILNRARDIEGVQDIRIGKWLLLGLLPIVCLYGQYLLVFKRGKK